MENSHFLFQLKLLWVFIDIDECETGIHACHKYASCTNTVGSYECSCEKGYVGDGRYCSGKSLGCCCLLKAAKNELFIPLVPSLRMQLNNSGC